MVVPPTIVSTLEDIDGFRDSTVCRYRGVENQVYLTAVFTCRVILDPGLERLWIRFGRRRNGHEPDEGMILASILPGALECKDASVVFLLHVGCRSPPHRLRLRSIRRKGRSQSARQSRLPMRFKARPPARR